MTTTPSASPCIFFKYTATTEIYTLSLHDALPIYVERLRGADGEPAAAACAHAGRVRAQQSQLARLRRGAHGTVVTLDRKSTRLNSSHPSISYAAFCLKKKIQSPAHRLVHR